MILDSLQISKIGCLKSPSIEDAIFGRLKELLLRRVARRAKPWAQRAVRHVVLRRVAREPGARRSGRALR